MASSRLPVVDFGGSEGSRGGDRQTAGVGEADAGAGTMSGLSDSCPCGREPVRGFKGSQRLGDGEDGSSPD